MPRPGQVIAGLQGLRGWRRYGLAGLLGLLLAAAQAPLYLWPLAFVAFVTLFLLNAGDDSRRRGFFTVYAFAYAYFVAGLYWIGIAFFVDAERFALLVPLPVLGLPLLLALFPAGGLWLACRAAARLALPWRMLLAVAGWTLGEWLRGFVLTGFPWNLAGYVWADWPAAMQVAAVTGVHGLGALTLLAAAGFAIALHGETARRVRMAALLLPAGLVAAIAAGTLRLVSASDAMVPDVRLRLVQPSVPQTLKWRDDLRQKHLQRHVELTVAPAEGGLPPTHVIWPETAIPYLLDEAEDLRLALARIVPPGGALVAGAIRRSFDAQRQMTLFNTLFVLDGTGTITAAYDKLHLVPFGEYLPFRRLLHPLGLDALAAGSIDFSAGSTAAALTLVPGLPPIRALICYEAIFPAEILGGGERPGLLLNITNDAWFGHSSGPYQHFAAARMRAVEQGLPLVRAANNGISAIVDPYGRIVARLGLNEIGTVDGPLPEAIGRTPYAVWGDRPLLLACMLALVLAAWAGRRRRTGH